MCASIARADLAVRPVGALPSVLPVSEKPASPDPVSGNPNAGSNIAAGLFSPVGLLESEHWANLPVAPTPATSDEQVIRELPGLPGSASLFLSAVLSVGAMQLVRKAGNVHLAHLPEWYHPDAPHQIGHSVVFDPLVGFEMLAV